MKFLKRIQNKMRQFVSSKMPTSDGRLNINGKDYKYLRQVLRLQKGQVLDVRLPSGELTKMQVEQITTSSLCLCIIHNEVLSNETTETGVSASELENSTKQSTNIWLLQFITKPQNMDLIVRQATEAGISVIVPVKSMRSQKNDAANRMERWNRIIREARQQSGSPIPTKIIEPCTLQQAIELWNTNKKDNYCSIVLYEEIEGSKTIHESIIAQKEKKQYFDIASLVVGCEGGIAPEELEELKGNDFYPVHFNTNILKAETAAIYGISALHTILAEHNIC